MWRSKISINVRRELQLKSSQGKILNAKGCRGVCVREGVRVAAYCVWGSLSISI